MKQPVLVSWRGSEEVRGKCAVLLESQLQTVQLQWRRSDAEFPLPVQINVELVPYAATLIRRRDSKWQDVAGAHLYFLDCWDAEKYRLDVRPDLVEWFATLRDADTNDWLVVFDACKAREGKGRNQVLEKLRSDLSKYVNRIVEIDSGYHKIPTLLRALADQCLVSFDYWARLFEAALKNERDICFNLDWSFLGYMILQVQYSRVLLSVNLFDQSLAQLDELDAMLSLLISHFTASSSKPHWIESLCISNTGKRTLISLVSLYSLLDDAVRQLMSCLSTEGDQSTVAEEHSNRTTDLRWIRALIFSCQLSVILNRYASQLVSADAACQSVIGYGAVLVQAIRKEEATLSGMGEDQKGYRRLSNALWCLEVLHFAGRLCDLALISDESEAACSLWMTLCRMVQQVDPSSMDHSVDSVIWEKSNAPPELDSPILQLEKCVVDASAYDEHFVKWHESALAMLKHHGWRRHARTLGVALADFYRSRDKVTEALHLYLKLARQLEDERWSQGYVGLLLTIGDELFSRCTLRERLKYYGDLSCAGQHLPSSLSASSYCLVFKSQFESDWSAERLANSPVCPWFIIRSIKPKEKCILCGCHLYWTAVVESKFTETMPISSISLCCAVSPHNRGLTLNTHQDSVKLTKLFDFRRESCSAASEVSDCVDLYQMKSLDGETVGELVPGQNIIQFSGQCSCSGACSPEHLHIGLGDGRLDVQVRVRAECTANCVIKVVEPDVVLISPVEGEFLWAGVTQTVKFCLRSGAIPVGVESEDEKYLRLESSNSDLHLKSSDASTDSESDLGVSLVHAPSEMEPGTSVEIEKTVFCNIHGSEESRCCRVTTFWRGRSFDHVLQFKPIFHWMSDLKVIGGRLLLSITLHNDGERPLVLRDPKLTFSALDQSGDVDAELLNEGSVDELHCHAPYTLAWYVPPACSSLGVIVFNYQFKDSTADSYTCYADVALQRPAIIEACCQMASEKIVCRVGMACDFVVSLKALDASLRSVDVLVTLVFDEKFWTCSSDMTELIRLKDNGLGQALFQVIPQCVGFLPMPAVKAQLCGDISLSKACQAYVRSKGRQVHVLAPMAQIRRSFNEQRPLELQL